ATSVSIALHDRSLMRVDDLSRRVGVSMRSLERLFRVYVGVSPKWTLRRFRLMDAAMRLQEGTDVDWASLAVDLGYFDQAHLINDFRTHVGLSPTRYARQARHGTALAAGKET